MKKVILLTVLSVVLFGNAGKAQGVHFVTSFGVEQRWDLPYEVYYSIDRYYTGYEWVHASRSYNRGQMFFDVVLRSGDAFIRVNLTPRGRIYRRVVTYDYPFANHVCSDYCGYHSGFYRNFNSSCNSHHHHGHNHVIYRPVAHAHGHHNNGNHYGHGYEHKGNHHGGSHHKSGNSNSHRMDYNNGYRERRSGAVKVASSHGDSRSNHRSNVGRSNEHANRNEAYSSRGNSGRSNSGRGNAVNNSNSSSSRNIEGYRSGTTSRSSRSTGTANSGSVTYRSRNDR